MSTGLLPNTTVQRIMSCNDAAVVASSSNLYNCNLVLFSGRSRINLNLPKNSEVSFIWRERIQLARLKLY